MHLCARSCYKPSSTIVIQKVLVLHLRPGTDEEYKLKTEE